MKKLLNRCIEKFLNIWTCGASCLLYDGSISFYTFFSLIFAECAYLWTFYNSSLAIPFTIIFLGYVLNVIICAFFKGLYEGELKEQIFTIMYIVDFILLFIIGCFINIKICAVFTVIPLLITALCIIIRNTNLCFFIKPNSSFWKKIGNLIIKLLVKLLELIILVGPFIVFVFCLAQIETLPTDLKIIISVLYFLCIPLISYYEDDTATLNIFELAFEMM